MITAEQMLIEAVGVENAGVDFHWDEVMHMMKIYQKQFEDEYRKTKKELDELKAILHDRPDMRS